MSEKAVKITLSNQIIRMPNGSAIIPSKQLLEDIQSLLDGTHMILPVRT